MQFVSNKCLRKGKKKHVFIKTNKYSMKVTLKALGLHQLSRIFLLEQLEQFLKQLETFPVKDRRYKILTSLKM